MVIPARRILRNGTAHMATDFPQPRVKALGNQVQAMLMTFSDLVSEGAQHLLHAINHK
jgi:hypothetical protein